MKTFSVKTTDQWGPMAIELRAETADAARTRVEKLIAGAHFGIVAAEVLSVEEVLPSDRSETEL